MRFIKVLLVFMLMAACSPSPPEQAQFTGGVQGIGVSVLDGAPPPAVTDKGSGVFGVSMLLENIGEADVGPNTENPFVVMRLRGIHPESWGTLEQNLSMRITETMLGSKRTFDGAVLPGEVASVSFQPLSYQHQVPGSELFTLRAELCYDYATHTTLKICIKDDILENLQDDSLCRLRSPLRPQNSGAPVHVVEAQQNPVGDSRIQVNFVIQNVDQGVFFNRADNSDEACGFDVADPGIYRALIVVNPVDEQNYQLDCRGLDNTRPGFSGVAVPGNSQYGVIKFHDNSPRSLTCFLEKTGGASGRVFQDLMIIDIYYRYGDMIDIPVLVQSTHLS